MIGDFIINLVGFVLGVVVSPLRILSDVTLPSEIAQSISNVAPLYSSLDPILPIGTILFIITVIEIPFLIALALYIGIRWIYQKLPFIN